MPRALSLISCCLLWDYADARLPSTSPQDKLGVQNDNHGGQHDSAHHSEVDHARTPDLGAKPFLESALLECPCLGDVLERRDEDDFTSDVATSLLEVSEQAFVVDATGAEAPTQIIQRAGRHGCECASAFLQLDAPHTQPKHATTSTTGVHKSTDPPNEVDPGEIANSAGKKLVDESSEWLSVLFPPTASLVETMLASESSLVSVQPESGVDLKDKRDGSHHDALTTGHGGDGK